MGTCGGTAMSCCRGNGERLEYGLCSPQLKSGAYVMAIDALPPANIIPRTYCKVGTGALKRERERERERARMSIHVAEDRQAKCSRCLESEAAEQREQRVEEEEEEQREGGKEGRAGGGLKGDEEDENRRRRRRLGGERCGNLGIGKFYRLFEGPHRLEWAISENWGMMRGGFVWRMVE
ncbi:hypothetical protein AXG93_4697s1160 [Marchantia polymorpha subsp. ruderalis]|uniref:Uncharacterized protein n=1 Tax=Marchantia polymorpha subsp. ruderalis TaxID=1480154 RepID=A0A176VNI1_MARPO|nr:hypothetical protein AXG93_4697s1160 [Marchantia polymorpha subsp. ruderalis]